MTVTKLLLLFSLGASQAIAAPAALPPELRQQWERFQDALRADEPAAIAALAKFPIRSNEFGGNIANAKTLKNRYATIFPAATKKCLISANLQAQKGLAGHYEVYCDVSGYPIRFLFNRVGRQYYFTGIDNINE